MGASLFASRVVPAGRNGLKTLIEPVAEARGKRAKAEVRSPAKAGLRERFLCVVNHQLKLVADAKSRLKPTRDGWLATRSVGPPSLRHEHAGDPRRSVSTSIVELTDFGYGHLATFSTDKLATEIFPRPV